MDKHQIRKGDLIKVDRNCNVWFRTRRNLERNEMYGTEVTSVRRKNRKELEGVYIDVTPSFHRSRVVEYVPIAYVTPKETKLNKLKENIMGKENDESKTD